MDSIQIIQDLFEIKMRNWVWLAHQLGISKARMSQIKKAGFCRPIERQCIAIALEVPYYMIWEVD